MVLNAFPPSIGHQSRDGVDLASEEQNPKSKELRGKRANPKFLMRSQWALNKKRKRVKDCKIVPGPQNRSIFTVEQVERITRENAEVRPTSIENFERSKPRGKKVYVSRNAQSSMEGYQRRIAENEQHEVVKPVEDVFYEAVGNRKKGQVYELGQSEDVYYSTPDHSMATSHTPPAITELQERLASNDRILAANEKIIAANEREIAAMQAELEEAKKASQQTRDFVEEMRRQMEFFTSTLREKRGSDFTPSQSHSDPEDPSSDSDCTSFGV